MNNIRPPITVLLIEDDQYLLSLYAAKFAESNFKVYSARDGLQAINIYNQFHPQVIVADLNLPQWRGDDVLRVIAQESAETKPVCVILSNYDREVVAAAAALPEIVSAYFVKVNTTPQEVVEMVKSLWAAKPVKKPDN